MRAGDSSAARVSLQNTVGWAWSAGNHAGMARWRSFPGARVGVRIGFSGFPGGTGKNPAEVRMSEHAPGGMTPRVVVAGETPGNIPAAMVLDQLPVFCRGR